MLRIPPEEVDAQAPLRQRGRRGVGHAGRHPRAPRGAGHPVRQPLRHRLPAQVDPQGERRRVAAQERQRTGARHQVWQQHHGPHGMGLWLPSDARGARADHLRTVLLHHHLRPHAPRRHRSALCGAHVPHRARRQHRHLHHRRACRARCRRLQALPHAPGGLLAPLLQPDGHLHLLHDLASARPPHPGSQVHGQHHRRVPLVRPRLPRGLLLHPPRNLHGRGLRRRRAHHHPHHTVRPRRPLRLHRQLSAVPPPALPPRSPAHVAVAARAAALAAPVRPIYLQAAGRVAHQVLLLRQGQLQVEALRGSSAQ
mmetsp:Transcript_15757/g.37333  ORF Transcript_15757/g.37333 Transcript_15757/m.37333 type:complete len:311 (-) Transcript_15757:223-1155(-)